ncbi:hypothetical protein CE91St49_03050 [Emergencia timonensis]|nr:hypothetical protein CE91St49_03050 [Emergencia timonensis]
MWIWVMKDIMLKITGKQFSGDISEDQMEFITEGKLYEKGDSTYLIYDESEFSGFPGCKTTLKLTGDCIRMKRIGSEVGFGMEFIFEKGKRFNSKYHTPYGNLDMEVLTNDVVNNLTEEGFGDINIDYHVSLNGMAEGRNRLKIEVMQ